MIVQMCMRKSELDRVFRRKSDVPWNSAMQVAMCDLLNHMGAVVGMSNIAEDAEAMTWSVLRGHVAEIFSKNELDIFRTYAESKAPIIKAIRKNMGVEGLSPELVADAIVEYWSGCPFVVADFDNFFSNVGIEALSAITQGFVDRKYIGTPGVSFYHHGQGSDKAKEQLVRLLGPVDKRNLWRIDDNNNKSVADPYGDLAVRAVTTTAAAQGADRPAHKKRGCWICSDEGHFKAECPK